jgi:hypothetical protein
MENAFEDARNLYRDLFGNPEAKKPTGRVRNMQEVIANKFSRNMILGFGLDSSGSR